MTSQRVYDLEDRLIDYAVRVIRVGQSLPRTPEGSHIRNQMARSATSPAPNYAEAQSAESKADFINKLKIVLKELRETKVWLRMCVRGDFVRSPASLQPLLVESDELISIFVQSVKTASTRKR